MRNLLDNLFSQQWLNNLVLKIMTRLYNFSAAFLSYLAYLAEGKLHPKNRILHYAEYFSQKIKKTDQIIDIGCGEGYVSAIIARKAKFVLGIDSAKSKIQIAKSRYQKNNLKFICADALNYAYSQKFDKIILSNVLEHLDQRISFLRQLKKVAPTLLLRVPLITRDWLPIFLKEHGLDYRLDKSHFIEYTEKQLAQEIRAGGWKIVSRQINFGEFWGVLKKDG